MSAQVFLVHSVQSAAKVNSCKQVKILVLLLVQVDNLEIRH